MIENSNMFKILDHFVTFERLTNFKDYDLQDFLKKYSKDPFIQFLSANAIAGKKHILHATYISLLAFQRNVNFTKSLHLEILLTLAQVRQIKKAIEIMSPKNDDIIVLAIGTNKEKVLEVFKDVIDKLDGQKKEIVPDNKNLERLFEITPHQSYSHEDIICENMALIETLR